MLLVAQATPKIVTSLKANTTISFPIPLVPGSAFGPHSVTTTGASLGTQQHL